MRWKKQRKWNKSKGNEITNALETNKNIIKIFLGTFLTNLHLLFTTLICLSHFLASGFLDILNCVSSYVLPWASRSSCIFFVMCLYVFFPCRFSSLCRSFSLSLSRAFSLFLALSFSSEERVFLSLFFLSLHYYMSISSFTILSVNLFITLLIPWAIYLAV